MKLCSMEFENPDQLPLHELYFMIKKNGVQQKIAALNEYWMEKRVFTKYIPLPFKKAADMVDQVSIDEWLMETEWFNRDVVWLLELNHFRFWSQIVYDPECLATIISFLQEATPSYIPITSLTDSPQIIKVYSDTLKNVFTVLCRLITNKESNSEWISRQNLADLLYNKFLLSIPMIFDMLVAYGRENQGILRKFLDTLFVIEDKYRNDLKHSFQFVQQTFKQLEQQVNEAGSSILEDLSLHLLDISITIGMLVELCPTIRASCLEINLTTSMSSVYENVIPPLYKNIYAKDPSDLSLIYLNNARVELLKAFQCILNVTIEDVLTNPKQAREIAEKYIGVLIESAGDHAFVVDYQKLFSVENDLDILQQAFPKLDPLKIEFILKAYVEDTRIVNNNYMCQLNDVENVMDDVDESIEDTNGACALPTEKDSIETIRAVLPDLGDGFIQKLLRRYNNPEQAITAVLEGNLPPDLAEADLKEPEIPTDKYDEFFVNTGIDRLNIFDGDAFDVMTQDQPKGIIKKGKGFPGANSQSKILNDKSAIQAVRSKYLEYSVICDEVDNEYNDEYDDFYEALAESERKTTKALLASEIDDEESEDEKQAPEENQQSNTMRSKNEFCENPESIRARYEQARQVKFGAREGNKEWKNRDMVGKPKGQGQSNEVLKNRLKKTVNKSQHGNHNRKSGANFKRSRGMIPS